MVLSRRSAEVRGDDFHHVVGWLWACRMLHETGIVSVSVEDAGGGAFDDVVVRRRSGGHVYIQAKSSNRADKVVDRKMLLTPARANTKSPLQRFHDTFTDLAAEGDGFWLELWTHKGFDHANPLLGEMRDLKHDRIDVDRVLEKGPRSKVGRERDAWAAHLGISKEALAEFLRRVRWKHTGSEIDIRGEAKIHMKLVGLRCDENAAIVGAGIVRGWVSDGMGPQTAEDVGRQAAEFGLVLDAPDVPLASADGEWAELPPPCRDTLAELRQVSEDTADRVAAELGKTAARVPGVLARLADDPPEWLQDADSLAWKAIGDFLGAHELPGASDVRDREIEMGSARAAHYRIGDALSAHSGGDADRAASLLGETPLDHPLAAAALALVSGNAETAIAEILRCGALDSQDTGHATMAIQMLALAHSESGETAQAISVMRDAVQRFPDRASFHLNLAGLQLGLAQELGDASRRDLPESAAENAIWARDKFRKWHGPSAEAVALAALAFHMLDLPQRVVDVAAAPPDGEATPPEADNGDVARGLAHALLMLGRGDEIGEETLERIDGSENTLIRGLQAHSRGESEAADLIRQAVDQADNEREMLMALEGLALLGETDVEALNRITPDRKAQADGIRASAAYRRGDLDTAISLTDPYRCQSAAHVGLLAAALSDQGRDEDACDALLESAQALSDPMLYLSAVRLLIGLEEFQRAEQAAQVALATNPSRAAESSLRAALVEAAEMLGDWPLMERYAQGLAAAFPDNRRARWGVVFAQHRQARFREAWGYLVEHGLRPVDEPTALLAISVYTAAGASADGVDRLLWIASEFADSEEVVGRALGAVMAGSRGEGQRSEAQASQLQEMLAAFTRDYPDSDALRQYSVSGPEDFLEMVRTRSEQTAAERASLFASVRFGHKPYGILQMASPLPYAESLLLRAAGYVTAVSADAGERAAEREAAQVAVGGIVAVDTSVAAVGQLADIDVATMGDEFERVLIASELLDDAQAAVASAGMQADAYAGYDPVADRFVLSEVQEHETRQEIENAELLLAALRGWQRTPSSRIQPPGYPQQDSLRPWDASIRLALDRGCALWSDDLSLRRVASMAGVPAFGTYALSEVLAAGGTEPLLGWTEFKMRFLRAWIADIPITVQELAEAADDSDGPDTAAEFFLGRPASWALDPDEALRWYLGRITALMAGPHRDRIPGLLVAACCGLGWAADLNHRQHALGWMLAETLWLVNDPATTPVLLEAARYAGRAIDLTAHFDPIEPATRRFLEILQDRQIDEETAAQIMLAVFSQAEPADRLAVSSIVFGSR